MTTEADPESADTFIGWFLRTPVWTLAAAAPALLAWYMFSAALAPEEPLHVTQQQRLDDRGSGWPAPQATDAADREHEALDPVGAGAGSRL